MAASIFSMTFGALLASFRIFLSSSALAFASAISSSVSVSGLTSGLPVSAFADSRSSSSRLRNSRKAV